MIRVAFGALRKLSPQPVCCWEWGRIIYLPYCTTRGKNHDYTRSEQVAEHRAGCYYCQLPLPLAQGPMDVGAWLLKQNVVQPGT